MSQSPFAVHRRTVPRAEATMDFVHADSLENIAASSPDPLAPWVVQLEYAPKIHSVNPNYFTGRLKDSVSSRLQKLYNTCLGR